MPGQYWSLNTAGGYFAAPRLSMKLYAAAQPLMRFRQFTDKDPDFGKGRGDTLLFDKIFDVTTQGGQLTENVPIPQTSFPVQQGSCVAVEYGNSIPWSEKVETLSEFDINDPIVSRATDDMAKVMNTIACTQFRATQVNYATQGSTATPTGVFDFDGTQSSAFATEFNVDHLWEIREALKTGRYTSSSTASTTTIRPVPPWDGENYIAIGSVEAHRGILRHPDFEEAAKYGDPERLLAGEVGRFLGFRFIEENHLLAGTTGGYRGEWIFFGKEAVKEIVVVPEELRRKIPMDFGRDRGVAWYAILGMKIIWVYNSSTEVENRIIRAVSA